MAERKKRPPPPAHKRLVFGRRLARPLTAQRQDLMDRVLPRIAVPLTSMTGQADLDPRTLFSVPCDEVWFEVGFGDGAHLRRLLDTYPHHGLIGAEPFINGVATFLTRVQDRPLSRLRLHNEDAMMLIRSLTSQSLDRIYILNPDPWPKARHHKRRIVQPETLRDFARVLKPGGQLTLTTDVSALAEWMALLTVCSGLFDWTAKTAVDWQTPPPGWQATKYEQKGQKAGRTPVYLQFCRKSLISPDSRPI